MQVTNPETTGLVEPARESGGCLSDLGFHAASFVLPIASLSFYRRAAERRTGSAVLFFILFMGIVAILTTIGVARGLLTATDEIQRAFLNGNVPEITITAGEAVVRAPQPAILIDQDDMLVAIDTTGQLNAIDRTRYYQGLLLNRYELKVLNRGESQTIPLAQLNQLFQQDPLVINAETTARMWQNFSVIFSLAAFFALALWNVVVRFMYLAALAVAVWGAVSLFRKTDYSTVLIAGIYAFVPALILHQILNRFGVRFIFLQTLILLVVWGIGLYAALVKQGWDLLGPDRPLRSWRALLGLPLLAVLVLDILFNWANGGLILLAAAALTGIALVAAGMFTLKQPEDAAI
jgi:Protein of unknown function (DUF1189)